MNKIKDPNARLDYAFDWKTPAKDPETGEYRSWLASGETISSRVVSVTKGDVVLDGDTESAGIVTVWVKQGTPGTTAWVTCHITTSAGRQDDRSIVISVTER